MVSIEYIVTILLVVLFSMTLHEAMHAFMSYWLGDHTAKEQGRLTFNPIAHIDPFFTVLLPILLALTGGPIFGGAKPVPFNPSQVKYGEFGAMLVGVVGPLTNLVIAFIAFGLLATIGSGSLFAPVLEIVVMVNLGFFIFNMIPLPPLDGSRVLYLIAPDYIRKVMASMEMYGILVIFALVLLFGPVFTAFMQSAISFFLDVFAAIFGAVI